MIRVLCRRSDLPVWTLNSFIVGNDTTNHTHTHTYTTQPHQHCFERHFQHVQAARHPCSVNANSSARGAYLCRKRLSLHYRKDGEGLFLLFGSTFASRTVHPFLDHALTLDVFVPQMKISSETLRHRIVPVSIDAREFR